MPISSGSVHGLRCACRKARTGSPIGPSRRMTGSVLVKSRTVLGMPPGAVPPSKIRGTKPSNWARTAWALAVSGPPLRLALDEAKGPLRWAKARNTGWSGTRTATDVHPRGEAGGQVGQPWQHQGEGAGPERRHQAPGQGRHLRHHLIQLIFPGQEDGQGFLRRAALGLVEGVDGRHAVVAADQPIDRVRGRGDHRVGIQEGGGLIQNGWVGWIGDDRLHKRTFWVEKSRYPCVRFIILDSRCILSAKG